MFDALYARHRGGLYRYLLRQCRDAAAAEELYQDVWMNLIRARAGYSVQARFTTYLYRLAYDRLIDHYRKNSRATVSSFEEEGGEGMAELPDERERPQDETLDARRQAGRLMELDRRTARDPARSIPAAAGGRDERGGDRAGDQRHPRDGEEPAALRDG